MQVHALSSPKTLQDSAAKGLNKWDLSHLTTLVKSHHCTCRPHKNNLLFTLFYNKVLLPYPWSKNVSHINLIKEQMTFLTCFDKCSADCSDSLKHFSFSLFCLFVCFLVSKLCFKCFNKTPTWTIYIYIWQFDVTITVLVLLTAIKRPSITITNITISITNTSWYPFCPSV